MTQSLQSFNTLIETPFIRAELGGKTFGLTDKMKASTKTLDIDFVKSITIQKMASGTVNNYNMTLDYVITPGSDPNYIDKIISTDTKREILFSYGDLSQPSFSYKTEKAIITSVKPLLNVKNPKLTYTFNATSSATLNYSLRRSYDAKVDKPSKLIFELLYINKDNGLLDLFTGMANQKDVEVKGWIATNDIPVKIDAKQDISPLDYLRYLVSQMISTSNSFFGMVIHDSFDAGENGPWFEVVNSALRPASYDLEVDVGYPGSTPVFDFAVNNDTSFALITKYQDKIDKERVVDINRFGESVKLNDPSIVTRRGEVKSTLKSWWKSMTSFPISATLTIRGLIIPAILCQTLKINVLFFGRKYNYSGEYMVVGQTDTITTSGYRTILNLIRIKGENI